VIDILQNILAFFVALGILITFHEYGHYYVAKLCDVKILRFSVGFGRPLYKRLFGKDDSEFVLAALPLGGYVKMLDEREGQVPEQEKTRSFNNKSLGQRFAIVAAGPIFNFIFAIFAYWCMYMIGVSGLKPYIGEIEPGSIAEQSGLLAGDEILSIDGKRTPSWGTAMDAFVTNVVDQGQVEFTLLGENGYERTVPVDFSRITIDEMAGGQLFEVLGLNPRRPVIPAIMGEITPDSPAEAAGLLPGDEILAVRGESIKDWIGWVDIIRANPENTLAVEIMRDEAFMSLAITPEQITVEGETFGRIGARVDSAYQSDNSLRTIESYSVVESLSRGIIKTFDMSLMTLQILGKMIVGEASVKNLSGPISIAQYAGTSAELGIVAFLNFLAIVSISLGVLNLLPIPLLDGGHLFYYMIEFFKGSPVSESIQIIGQQIGIAFLFGLMGLAFYNDILRLAS
jgi:regulator of sigma E protease